MSHVVIAGGHGQIALRLAALLSARGDRVCALIRNPDHEADVRATGARPVVADLEALDDLSDLVEGVDAVVFAAGAGPGSGPERKRTVDLGAAVKLLEGARRAGVRRYLMISSMGAGRPCGGLRGDAAVPRGQGRRRTPRWRPATSTGPSCAPAGSPTSPGRGASTAAGSLGRFGSISRDDVAAVLAACLDEPRTVRATFELLQGETPIAQALAAL